METSRIQIRRREKKSTRTKKKERILTRLCSEEGKYAFYHNNFSRDNLNFRYQLSVNFLIHLYNPVKQVSIKLRKKI